MEVNKTRQKWSDKETSLCWCLLDIRSGRLLRKHIKPCPRGFMKICGDDRPVFPVWFTLPHFLLTTAGAANTTARIKANREKSRGDQREKNVTTSSSLMQSPGEFSLVCDMIKCEWRWVSGVPDLTQSHCLTSNWTAWWQLHSCCCYCCCYVREAAPTGGLGQTMEDKITQRQLGILFHTQVKTTPYDTRHDDNVCTDSHTHTLCWTCINKTEDEARESEIHSHTFPVVL